MTGTGSWLDIALTLGALIDDEGRAVPGQLSRGGVDYLIAGCDLGNSALKLALRQADAPQLRRFRFAAVYTPAAIVRAGDDATAVRVCHEGTWREWFWPHQPDSVRSEALPIGSTAERLADPRIIDFLLGALVEALDQSGYVPGGYTLWLGFGVPNDEVTRSGVRAETRQALYQLRGQTFVVERRTPAGELASWRLTIGELVPAPQSLGTFFAWYHTLRGQPAIDDVDRVTIADLGGGHLSRFDVELVRQPNQPPRFRGMGGIVSEGMVVIARELVTLSMERYRVRLSETLALQALMQRTLVVAGRRVPIDDLIAGAAQTRGQPLLAALTPLFADLQRFPIITGGGAAALHAELATRAAAAQRSPDSYLIIPADITAMLNAVGLFALALYAAQRGSA